MAREVPGGRFIVAPHYFDWSLFKDLPGPELARQRFPSLNTEKPKVLSLSRLHPVKGADVLLRSVAQVLKQGVELKLYLAGPDEGGYRSVLERLVQSLNIEPYVHFLGMVRGRGESFALRGLRLVCHAHDAGEFWHCLG